MVKHDWQRYPSGEIDLYALETDNHTGVRCVRCDEVVCTMCNPAWLELDDCEPPDHQAGAVEAATKAVRDFESMLWDNYLEQEREIKVVVEATFKYLSDHGLLLSDEARGIIEAAQQMVADRDEVYGNASRPAWWNGFDWPVVKAVNDYKKAGKRDPS